MKEYLFVVNPIAGGGKGKNTIDIIESIMSREKYSYEIIKTEYAKQGTKIVEDNIEDFKVFVAVGGDGSINEVAQGLVNNKKGKLAIIPNGTGNDLAKQLEIPLDPKISLKRILNGKERELDVIKANNHNFMNIGSIGYDSEVIYNYNDFRDKISGKLSYLFSVLYTLIGFKSKKMEIEIDGEKFRGNYTLLALGNGKYYGGGFKILPKAKVDDGKIHICIVSELSRFKILLLFPTILFGIHIKIAKYVKIYKANTLNVKLEEAIWLNLDGELVEKTDYVQFALEKYKIKLIS